MDTMNEIFEGKGNEIPSLRELAIITKEQLRIKGYHAPDEKKLFGIRIDDRTVFYYSTRERRNLHVEKLKTYLNEYGSMPRIELLNPEK